MRLRRLLGMLLLAAASLKPAGASAAGALTYIAHPPTIASAHPPLILLLHGSGADERDMIGLWAQLPGQFVVVSPRAPFSDGGGYRWYRKLDGKVRTGDLDLSRKIIDVLVESAIQRFDADPGKVFLAGFSQGAVMVYEVALREPGRFRGAAVLSGTLFPSAQAELSALKDPGRESFFVAHGTADPRIPFENATAARAALARSHVPTAFHAYTGMGHEIGDVETKDLGAWLTGRAAPR
jgi:phospholipase/carboxylesterase